MVLFTDTRANYLLVKSWNCHYTKWQEKIFSVKIQCNGSMSQTRSWNEVKSHSLIQGKLGKVTAEENFAFYSSSILIILVTSAAAQN